MIKRNLLNIVIGSVIGLSVALIQINAWESHEYVNPIEEQIEVPIIIEEVVLLEAEAEEPEVVEAEHEEVETDEIEVTYSEEELNLLAHLLMGECGADWCLDEMVWNVGSVALNRVNSDEFPDTLEDVIYQKGQYACVKDGNFEKEPTDRCWEIAEELLLYGSVLPEDVVFQAEFKQGSEVYVQIQNMYFCRR